MGITQAINFFNSGHTLIVISLVFQPESRRKTFSKLPERYYNGRPPFAGLHFVYFSHLEIQRSWKGIWLSVRGWFLSFCTYIITQEVVHCNASWRFTELNVIYKKYLFFWFENASLSKLNFFLTKDCFQAFFHVKKIWHLFNILF